MNCPSCGDPLTGGSVPLDAPDGGRVNVCGFCFLKGYTAEAFNEDKPKAWANSTDDLDTHISAMVKDDSTPTETYE